MLLAHRRAQRQRQRGITLNRSPINQTEVVALAPLDRFLGCLLRGQFQWTIREYHETLRAIELAEDLAVGNPLSEQAIA